MGIQAALQAELLFLFKYTNDISGHASTWIPVLRALTTKRLIINFFIFFSFSSCEKSLEEEIHFYIPAFLTGMQVEMGL